ncbi:hypothetical protein [Sphaerisporangium perillae]|uniref:hypothetical protein n=1 Tax=Sphaerisporangium perillae TaxID=2935860 RepID=UPI00200F0172|nr:hypothetical protein [Sphaerisporangium perillae]
MISNDSNADSNRNYNWAVHAVNVDPTPYLNRTNLTFYIDSHIVDAEDEAVVYLRRLRTEGWISLQRTDTMDMEFGKATGEKWASLTNASSGYPEALGPMVLDHSRLDASVQGDAEDKRRLHDVFSILFPAVQWEQARDNHIHDAMHVATSIRYCGDGFVTREKRLLNKHDAVSAAFEGFHVWCPEQAIEEANGRIASMRELYRREPERGELPAWP